MRSHISCDAAEEFRCARRNLVQFVAHMAALLHPVKGERPKCMSCAMYAIGGCGAKFQGKSRVVAASRASRKRSQEEEQITLNIGGTSILRHPS
jgi:hypothetical protein